MVEVKRGRQDVPLAELDESDRPSSPGNLCWDLAKRGKVLVGGVVRVDVGHVDAAAAGARLLLEGLGLGEVALVSTSFTVAGQDAVAALLHHDEIGDRKEQ